MSNPEKITFRASGNGIFPQQKVKARRHGERLEAQMPALHFSISEIPSSLLGLAVPLCTWLRNLFPALLSSLNFKPASPLGCPNKA